ncbi:hypothetical protein QQ045_005973 [Rhodiola kirilowii]
MESGFRSNSEEDSKTTDLDGLNRGALSFVSQTRFPKFSYCISGRDSFGVLLFGETKFTWLKPLNYTLFVQVSVPLPYFDSVAYSVKLEGIRVGRKLLSLERSVYVHDHTSAGQTMVDSGTQFTFFLRCSAHRVRQPDQNTFQMAMEFTASLLETSTSRNCQILPISIRTLLPTSF